MLLKLSGRGLRPLTRELSERSFIGRITEDPFLPDDRRSHSILLTSDPGPLPSGFRAYLLRESQRKESGRDVFALGDEFTYLATEDVIRIDPIRCALQVLYRRASTSNSLLVTERCDNFCVMCSQPPKEHDDSWIVDELLEAIPLISVETRALGFTGGEPGLLGTRLVELVSACKASLPKTALHILSNGRAFASRSRARLLAGVAHPDLMVGIPLYSDLPERHDYVVQARGAFDETLQGILNLKEAGVSVELRFVIHRETYADLPAFARFVTRNLVFVDHVALMGLELMGFARSNIEMLWIDPADYQQELCKAAAILTSAGLRVSIYNHQLCVLHPSLHSLSIASISDWKNLYLDECEACELRSQCGGFFASSQIRRSREIARVTTMP